MLPLNDSGLLEMGVAARDEGLARVEIALLGVIFAGASLLNIGLLLLLWRQRKQMTRMRVFVFHLCVADLVVAFFQVCPQLIWDITDRFIGPDPVCRLVKYLQVLGMFSSTYMIVAMTIDRYQAVCHPMVKFQRARSRLNVHVCAAWGFSLLGSLPQVFIFSQVEVAPGVFDCWAKFIQPWGLKTYITWITLVIFVVPVAVVVFCQVRICRAIHSNLLRRSGPHRGSILTQPSRASGADGMSKARVRTLMMTVVIVLVYVLCWSPFFTVQLWSAWDTHAPTENASFAILMLLSSLNSCANPCIYLLFSGHCPRKPLARLCLRRLHRSSSSHDELRLVRTLYMSFKNASESK